MKKHIDDFLEETALKSRPRTVESKAYVLKQFLAFLKVKEVTQWQDCDSKLIRQYIIDRSKNTPENSKKPLSASSMKIQLSNISTFFAYLIKKKHIDHNPVEFIQAPKITKKLPKVLSVDLLHAILSTSPDNDLDIRDLAMCELFYSSGLRLSEMANLDHDHIDLHSNEVRVINGKGGKDRVVPLGSKAKTALLKWKAKRVLIKPITNKAIFVSKQGKRLKRQQIRNRVKACGQKFGLGFNLYPHLLRHSMATHMLESSKDIRAVQEMLGHVDISTTQAYTHLNFNHIAKVFDNAHPRAKKKPRL